MSALPGMTEDNPPVEVVFRMDRGKPGPFSEPTAVFPRIREGLGMASCYVHTGQHSACSLGWYRTTRPATEAEYAPLKRELERIGYHLKIRLKASAWAIPEKENA